MLRGDARDPGRERAVDAGAQRHGRAVRARRDGVAVGDLAPGGLLGGERELGLGPLELELGDPLDGGAGEERPVAQQAQVADEVLFGDRRRSRRRLGAGRRRLVADPLRQRRLLADGDEGDAAVELRRQLGEDARGVRGDLDAEPSSRAARSTRARQARAARPRGARAAAVPRDSGACRRARASPSPAGRGRPSRRRGRGTSSARSRRPRALRAPGRSDRRPRRRRTRSAARSAPDSAPRRRRPRPTPRRRRAHSAWTAGGRPRSPACPRSRARARARRAARRRLHPAPTRSGSPARTRAAACRARAPARPAPGRRGPRRPARRGRRRRARP